MQGIRQIASLEVSVDCVVFGFDENRLKLLLIEQRQAEDGNIPLEQLQAALPGDLVLEDESLDECAARVLKELTNLEGIYLKQFHAFGDPGRVRDLKDQDWLRTFRAAPEKRVITIAYYSLVKMEDYHPQPSSFAGKAFWVNADDVPSLAFDHNHIVQTALDILREEVKTQHIGFELLPDKFTLTQLQQLYEIILDRKLDKRNFRKNVKKIDQLIPLDEKQQGVLHKPAQLYKFEKGDMEE
jgi:8-oxo-dGTP diphosphatase